TKTTYKVTKIEANLVTLESSSTSEVLKKPMLGTYILDAKTGVIKTSKGSGVMDMGMMQMKISADYSIQ
ncbi:MAG TPA: hypothetical protein VL947_00755, partial [Cytophagales bacterium]|nr:hypothetical protein [Cytophagales bacterium]